MKGIVLLVLASIALPLAQALLGSYIHSRMREGSSVTAGQGEFIIRGEGEDLLEVVEEMLGSDEEDSLQCFRCDLGFWDACYTTTVHCSSGERCFTGRGKAADLLDVKLLGCAKTEDCGVQTTVELYPNSTLFTLTKHCCRTSFCNAVARSVPLGLCSYLTAPALSLWCLTGAATRLH